MRIMICALAATYEFLCNDKYGGKAEVLVALLKNSLKGRSKELHDHYP